jgi:hypothetical protein
MQEGAKHPIRVTLILPSELFCEVLQPDVRFLDAAVST